MDAERTGAVRLPNGPPGQDAPTRLVAVATLRRMAAAAHPTVILGAKHSGTTIFYRMLSLHPAFTWFSQFSQRDGTVPDRFRVPLARHADRTLRRLTTYDWRKEESRWKQLVVPRPGEGTRIWRFLVPEHGALPDGHAAARIRSRFHIRCIGDKKV